MNKKNSVSMPIDVADATLKNIENLMATYGNLNTTKAMYLRVTYSYPFTNLELSKKYKGATHTYKLGYNLTNGKQEFIVWNGKRNGWYLYSIFRTIFCTRYNSYEKTLLQAVKVEFIIENTTPKIDAETEIIKKHSNMLKQLKKYPELNKRLIPSFEQYLANPETERVPFCDNPTLKTRSIASFLSSKLNKWDTKRELDRIKQAVENKEKYDNKFYGENRDLSIYISFEYQSGLSSEFSGNGHGSYYLIISPTTAIFYEND